MRSVKATVGLQRLFRERRQASSPKVSSGGLTTRTHVRGELLRHAAKGVSRRCESAKRTRSLAVLPRDTSIDTAAGNVEPIREPSADRSAPPLSSPPPYPARTPLGSRQPLSRPDLVHRTDSPFALKATLWSSRSCQSTTSRQLPSRPVSGRSSTSCAASSEPNIEVASLATRVIEELSVAGFRVSDTLWRSWRASHGAKPVSFRTPHVGGCGSGQCCDLPLGGRDLVVAEQLVEPRE